MDAFSAPHFTNDEAARKFLADLRWPSGTVCPHCGVVGHAYQVTRVGKTGKVPAFGVYRCAEKVCRKDFSVTTGTVMERSHIALHKWLQAFYLMCSSKKGVSAHQLHRSLDITYKAAWFMAHRIREAMKAGGLAPLGGDGKTVEMDETYIGKRDTPRVRGKYATPFTKTGGTSHKRVIISLVERGGSVRSFHVDRADKATITKIVSENIAKETRLTTDESRLYNDAINHVAEHDRIEHGTKKYVRYEADRVVHTNTIEGVFSIFKRGMKGIYQHCGEKHLHRYLSEFDFRYSHRVALGVNDEARTNAAIKGAEGKRLTYRQAN